MALSPATAATHADLGHGPGADDALGDLHPARPRRTDSRDVWSDLGWVSAIGLGIACIGALLTEFSGVAGVGELYGLPRYASLPIAALALRVVVVTGAYRRVERVAIVVGLFELAFC